VSTIKHWFDNDGDAFELHLRQAIRDTEDPRGLDFLGQVEAAWREYGIHARMSQGQYLWFCRLAGIDPDD
jgi:hypothetical protein